MKHLTARRPCRGSCRLGLMTDEAHVRLGLVLLDSAAELLMHRQCDWLLLQAEQDRGLLQTYKAIYDATGRGANTVAELQDKVVSNTRLKKIERDFNAKCDFLGERGRLAEPQIRILKKLHKYRNETYHRDELRSATLMSAARIYIYLVCSMMRDFPVFMIGYSASDPPPALASYMTENEHGPGLLGVGTKLQARIAMRLLDESGVAEPAQLGHVLSQHVCDRLTGLEKAAEESADFLCQQGEDEGWDLEAILRLVQLDPEEWARVRSSADARTLDTLVHGEQIRQWRAAAQALAEETDDLTAFAAFADLEDVFESVEARVLKLAMDIDSEIQMQFDLARGK